MPTETENYIDEEMLRDAEMGVEAERTPEFAEEDDEEDRQPKVEDLTDDPALQDVLKFKGGMPEDWELTYRGTAEYFFNGSEVINVQTGESWTKQIEKDSDEANIAVHHAMLEQWKNGESLTRLPDFEEEKGNGDVVLHVTHLIRGADNSVSYEIRSTVISRREEEDIFVVEEGVERTEAYTHVAFQESAEMAIERRVEPVSETAQYAYETIVDSSSPIDADIETPVVQEVETMIRAEQRTETAIESPAGEVVGETEKGAAEDSWLYDLLKNNILIPTPEQHEVRESTPFVENVEEKINTKVFEVSAEQSAVVTHEVSPIERYSTQPKLFVAPMIEQIPSFEEPATKSIREVAMPKVEQKQTVKNAEQAPIEKRGVKTATEPVVKTEKIQLITAKTFEPRKHEVISKSEIRLDKKTIETAVTIVHEKQKSKEVMDGPTAVEPTPERALNGREILLRALGLPTVPRIIQPHEIAHIEGQRPTRYIPPQKDEQTTLRSRGRVSTLHGISMRRAV